jgi:PAS domain S-box-containing protein
MSKTSILIVEDEYILARDLQLILRRAGYEVPCTAACGEDAIFSAEKFRPDLVLMDIKLQGSRDGISVADEIYRRFGIPVIYLTSYGDETVLNRAKATGPIGYILKPYEKKDLLTTIDIALSQHQTAVQKNRAALLAKETRFRSLLESVNWGMAVLNRDGCVLDTNQMFHTILGYSSPELRQRSLADIVHRDDLPRENEMIRTLLEGKTERYSIEQRNYCKAGEIIWVRSTVCTFPGADGDPRDLVLRMLEDITEERALKERLITAQRMETIDSLTRGLAHNLNNLLTPLTAGLQLLRSNFPQERSERLLHTMDLMDSSLKRSAYILRQLLNFGGGLEKNYVVIDPVQILREVATLAAEFFPGTIAIKLQILSGLWRILGNADQIHQSLLNLCVNARDAMPAGGTVTLAAKNVRLDASAARAIAGGKPGSYVLVSVLDSGSGISPEVKEKLFQPFFTTKPRGSGTGLGLATTLGIVKNHGGFIDLTSNVGEGTEFRVYLPAHLEPAENGDKGA